MVQLSADSFALGNALLSVEAAQALISERIPALMGEDACPIAAAAGRVLARALVAPQPLPPFNNSAVDGYAFRHADLAPQGESRLRLDGRIAAGQQAAQPLVPGTAQRILTGAPMPAGADTVMMQEDARLDDGALLLPAGLALGANCRPAGEDVARGAEALPAGRRLRAPDIGLAAALGCASLPVVPLVRVGVFSTGDELASPGRPLGPAQTYDSNRFTLLAMLAGLPVVVSDLGILPDRAAETRAALTAAASGHDLLLTSGGVSAGEEDHVRAVIEAEGRLVFWRLAVKPGRAAAMGIIGGTPVIGLPGNPVAAVVNFLHLARPVILRLAGALAEPLPRFPARAAFHYRKKAGIRDYVRVRLTVGDPLPEAAKFEREGSAMLTSLTQSDAFAELPEAATEVNPGDIIRILPFAACF